MSKVRGLVVALRREGTQTWATVKLEEHDGASGLAEVSVNAEQYEKFARSWMTGPFAVEVDLKFDKLETT